MKVEQISYENLTDDEKSSVPNNGGGKEDASYIKVTHHGETIALESDAMEPEDCYFYRDLSWVAPLIKRVYELGLKEPM